MVMMRPRYTLARRKAAGLIQQAGINRPPVPVERLAELAGATLRYEPFDGQLSGLLYQSSDGSIIGVNSLHAPVRQRFSIAHEIGHLLLHEPQLQIDDHAFVVFRDPESSKASDPHEIEANQFAAALLMPESLLAEGLRSLGQDPDVEEAIRSLSRSFEVSQEAMTIRLTSLRWLTQ
jgi:Zn-dependent peptidase ImmA (M78 family)